MRSIPVVARKADIDLEESMKITIQTICRNCILSHEKCVHQPVLGKVIDLMYQVDNEVTAFKGTKTEKPFHRSSYESYDSINVDVKCEWFRKIPDKPVKEIKK